MPTVESSSSVIPSLGVGTFRLKDDEAYNSVTMALDIGYRHIDTAQIYKNEAAVGRAIKDSPVPREDIFVTTKVWNDKLNRTHFVESVEESLRKLQLFYVDLLLIHWPSPEHGESMQEYLGELLRVKEMGLAKNIGISNFTAAQTEEAVRILGEGVIATNQIEVHPYLINEKVRETCAKHGIVVTGYMPFAVGKVLKDDTILSIAKKYNVTAAEVVVAWELAHGLVTIPSSTKRENLATNFKALSLKLDAEDVAKIDALDCGDRQATPDFAPDWD